MDPHWQEGQYDDANYPHTGMRLARKLGVITYRSSLEWNGRFGRVRMDEVDTDTPFSAEFVRGPFALLPAWDKTALADMGSWNNLRVLGIELGAGLAFAAGCVIAKRLRTALGWRP